MAIQLTKRNYLGEGYINVFVNEKDGTVLVKPCSKEEYERLGQKGGSRYNPVLEGYKWSYSAGGTIKVDTENSVLNKGDYTIVGEEVVSNLPDEAKGLAPEKLRENTFVKMTLDSVNKDGYLQEDNLTAKIK